MNQRDLSQIKRRLNPDKRNPTVIRGCYVSYDGQVISTFAQPVFHLPAEENEKYMSLFKRVLSGTAGQNLQEIEFSGMQAMEGEEHRILSTLRESGLTDEEAVNAFYERAISYIRAVSPADAQSVNEQQTASNYLILCSIARFPKIYAPPINTPTMAQPFIFSHSRSFTICFLKIKTKNKVAIANLTVI